MLQQRSSYRSREPKSATPVEVEHPGPAQSGSYCTLHGSWSDLHQHPKTHFKILFFFLIYLSPELPLHPQEHFQVHIFCNFALSWIFSLQPCCKQYVFLQQCTAAVVKAIHSCALSVTKAPPEPRGTKLSVHIKLTWHIPYKMSSSSATKSKLLVHTKQCNS